MEGGGKKDRGGMGDNSAFFIRHKQNTRYKSIILLFIKYHISNIHTKKQTLQCQPLEKVYSERVSSAIFSQIKIGI